MIAREFLLLFTSEINIPFVQSPCSLALANLQNLDNQDYCCDSTKGVHRKYLMLLFSKKVASIKHCQPTQWH